MMARHLINRKAGDQGSEASVVYRQGNAAPCNMQVRAHQDVVTAVKPAQPVVRKNKFRVWRSKLTERCTNAWVVSSPRPNRSWV